MFLSPLIWRMAIAHLRKNRRQLILTIIGSSIGTMLIMASVFFYASVNHSADKYMREHFGKIEWALQPVQNNNSFSQIEVQEIANRLKDNQIDGLPVIYGTVTLIPVKPHAENSPASINVSMLGLNLMEAVDFDPTAFSTSVRELGENEIIVSESTSSYLGISKNDQLQLRARNGQLFTVKVVEVIEEKGLSGYRGASGVKGTIFSSTGFARKTLGVSSKGYNVILAGGPFISVQPPKIFPYASDLFNVNGHKKEVYYDYQLFRDNYGYLFFAAGSIAILASLLLLGQLFVMVGQSRSRMLGVFRAIGLTRRQIQMIFLSETILYILFSSVVGGISGLSFGLLIMTYFQNKFAPTIELLEGFSVKLAPYLSLDYIVITLLFIMGVQLLVAWFVSRKMKTKPILSLMKEGTEHIMNSKGWFPKFIVQQLLNASIFFVIILFYFYVSGIGPKWFANNNPAYILVVFVTWILSIVGLTHLFWIILTKLNQGLHKLLRISGISRLSSLLSSRYPKLNYGRVYIVSLMFALVFTTLTLAIIVGNYFVHVSNSNEVKLFGFTTHIAYKSEEEKTQILQELEEDILLQKTVNKKITVEPYYISGDSKSFMANQANFSILPVTDFFIQNASLKLVNMDTSFSSNIQAWEAVNKNPHYVILDKLFSYGVSDWPETFSTYGIPLKALKVGDTISLNIRDISSSKPGSPSEVVETIEVQIIGFYEKGGDVDYQFKKLMLLNPALYNHLKKFGGKMNGIQTQGYVLLDYLNHDVLSVQGIEDQFRAQGITDLGSPQKILTGKKAMNNQVMGLYIVFIILAILIGLFGLLIIQYRSVQERSKHLAMLRCIGVSRKDLYHSFLIEGSMIGLVGIIAGFLIGTIGGNIFIEATKLISPPQEEPVTIAFPYLSLLLVLAIFMVVTIILNIIPARRTLQLNPGEAIRSDEE